MQQEERQYLHFKGNNRSRNCLRTEYFQTRNMFDKLLHKSERAYRLSRASDIEEMTTKKTYGILEKNGGSVIFT